MGDGDAREFYHAGKPGLLRSHAEFLDERAPSLRNGELQYTDSLEACSNARIEFTIGGNVRSLSQGIFEQMFKDSSKGINKYNDLNADQRVFIDQIVKVLDKGYLINPNALQVGDKFEFRFPANMIGTFSFYRSGEQKYDNVELKIDDARLDAIAGETRGKLGQFQMSIEGQRRIGVTRQLAEFATGESGNLYQALFTMRQKVSLADRQALLKGVGDPTGPFVENINGINKYLRLHFEHEKGLTGDALEAAMAKETVKPDGTGYVGSGAQNLAWMRWLRYDLYGYGDCPFDDGKRSVAESAVKVSVESAPRVVDAEIDTRLDEFGRSVFEVSQQIGEVRELLDQFPQEWARKRKKYEMMVVPVGSAPADWGAIERETFELVATQDRLRYNMAVQLAPVKGASKDAKDSLSALRDSMYNEMRGVDGGEQAVNDLLGEYFGQLDGIDQEIARIESMQEALVNFSAEMERLPDVLRSKLGGDAKYLRDVDFRFSNVADPFPYFDPRSGNWKIPVQWQMEFSMLPFVRSGASGSDTGLDGYLTVAFGDMLIDGGNGTADVGMNLTAEYVAEQILAKGETSVQEALDYTKSVEARFKYEPFGTERRNLQESWNRELISMESFLGEHKDASLDVKNHGRNDAGKDIYLSREGYDKSAHVSVRFLDAGRDQDVSYDVSDRVMGRRGNVSIKVEGSAAQLFPSIKDALQYAYDNFDKKASKSDDTGRDSHDEEVEEAVKEDVNAYGISEGDARKYKEQIRAMRMGWFELKTVVVDRWSHSGIKIKECGFIKNGTLNLRIDLVEESTGKLYKVFIDTPYYKELEAKDLKTPLIFDQEHGSVIYGMSESEAINGSSSTWTQYPTVEDALDGVAGRISVESLRGDSSEE